MNKAELLDDFYKNNRDSLMNYQDVLTKMSKFSFTSQFYFYRKLLPQYINEDDFLLAFEFGVCVLKDKLLFLGDKLWIYEEFNFLDNLKININESKISREKYVIKVTDNQQLNLFKLLINIFLNKEEKSITSNNNNKIKVVYDPDLDLTTQIHAYVKKMYKIYKSEAFILDENELKNKVNEIFLLSKGDIWTGWYDLKKMFSDKNGAWGILKSRNGVFGLKSGIYIYHTSIVFIKENKGDGFGESFEIDLSKITNDYNSYFKDLSIVSGKNIKIVSNPEKIFLMNLFDGCAQLFMQFKKIKDDENKLIQEKKRQNIEEARKRENDKLILQEENERQRKAKLEENKLSIILDLDKDGNKLVDLVDAEIFNQILINNQKSIIEIDKNYIQKFVKISMYLKTKKSNTQKIFESIIDTKDDTELNELTNLLKNQIYTYDLMIFHSISMVTSLIESDFITFYEIYECFDQLGVFNSNWENEVSDKLNNIGIEIKDLMHSIYHMENKLVNSINLLTYFNQSTFGQLNSSINSQLRKINSSLEYGNYMNKIQNYKMFDILI